MKSLEELPERVQNNNFNPDSENSNNILGNAYYEQKKYDQAVDAYQKAISINPDFEYPYNGLGNVYYEQKKYDQAIDAYQKAIGINPDFEHPYNGLGNVYYEQEKYDQAIDAYQKAISINPDFEHPYNGLGNVYYEQKKYDQAVDAYEKAISINPDFENSYNGLGNVYYEQKRYKEAIDTYKKVIKINPNYIYPYNGLGNVYYEQKRYKEAITTYQKAIELDSKFPLLYYHIGINYEAEKEYHLALTNFEKYIDISQNSSNYLKISAKYKIIDIKKILNNSDYTKISEIVDKIRNLLLFKGPYVTHYTGMTAAKHMILEKSKLRLSEGAFLNDTSEGRELFNFLPSLTEPNTTNATVALPFTPKPFIGSFVAETKHDDLTLWRMYGKENKEEAKGCAITLDRNLLLKNLKSHLTSDGKTDSTNIDDDEFRFYSVAYIQRGKAKPFIVPDAEERVVNELNKYMEELAALIEKFIKKKDANIPNLRELLNSIAYLFKTAEYYYEHELRLIMKGIGFKKMVDRTFTPPKVYVELIPIPQLIKKITLGPKVECAEEWASAFYYELDAEGQHPEIMISHLPFK